MDEETTVETVCCDCGWKRGGLWVHIGDKIYCWPCGQLKLPRQFELKFGQTVYLVEYYPGDEEGVIVVPCANPSVRTNRRNAVHRIRKGEYKIGEWRVISFDDREVYLHWRGFVDRPEVLTSKEHAELKLKQLVKQLEEEKKNDSSESEQLHGGGRELF